MKVLWDFEVRTDRVIPARIPDLIVVDKHEKKATIIDVAVPMDRNINNKEQEKVQKYQDLKLEIQRLWNVKADVVPITYKENSETWNPRKRPHHKKSARPPRNRVGSRSQHAKRDTN